MRMESWEGGQEQIKTTGGQAPGKQLGQVMVRRVGEWARGCAKGIKAKKLRNKGKRPALQNPDPHTGPVSREGLGNWSGQQQPG